MPAQCCFAILHYNGTNFRGWQRQKEDRTVQGEVEAVLRRLTGGPVPIIAAGRTDSGVHALGQTVSFQVPSKWNPEDLHRGLNALLPRDVWVREVGLAAPGFDARRMATARRYQYRIGCDAGARSPFRRPYEWALSRPLNAALLDRCANLFSGEHDFTAFAAVGQEKEHYRCRIAVCEWDQREGGEGVIFHVEANRFLHHMVRFMVGTMVDVGLGNRPLDDIKELLQAPDNSATSPPAPPEGLYLVRVDYPQTLKAR